MVDDSSSSDDDSSSSEDEDDASFGKMAVSDNAVLDENKRLKFALTNAVKVLSRMRHIAGNHSISDFCKQFDGGLGIVLIHDEAVDIKQIIDLLTSNDVSILLLEAPVSED